MYLKPLALLLLSTAYLTAAAPIRSSQDSTHDLLPRGSTTNPSRSPPVNRIPSASGGNHRERKKLDTAMDNLDEKEEPPSTESTKKDPVAKSSSDSTSSGSTLTTPPKKNKWSEKKVDTTLGGVPEVSGPKSPKSEGTSTKVEKEKKVDTTLGGISEVSEPKSRKSEGTSTKGEKKKTTERR